MSDTLVESDRRRVFMEGVGTFAFMHLGLVGFVYLVYFIVRTSGILWWLFAGGSDPQHPVVLEYVIGVLLFPLAGASGGLIGEGAILPMLLGFGLILLNSSLWGAAAGFVWHKFRANRVRSA